MNRFSLLACSALICFSAAAAEAGAAAPSASKSIVDPKYRKKAGDKDFVALLIDANATAYKDKVTKTKVEGTDEEVSTTTKVADGVDVDGLFALAAVNSLDVAKFQAQREAHGFPGRFRMTVSNMLRAATKNRHGMFTPGVDGGEPVWNEAPAEWLASKSAAEAPTHNRDGSKIVKPKPAAEAAPAEGAAAAE